LAADRLDRIVGVLRANGERVTEARLAVLHALLDSDGHRHLTAADVVRSARALDPALHRATVYRTLDLLTDLGIVEHVHVEHGAVVFHLTDERHQHLVCEVCGRVIDAPIGLLDDLARDIDRTYGFALHAGHEPLTGVCRSCRSATTDSTSIGMLRGSSDVPIAERAQRPRSGPYTSMTRSEKPLTTSG
jgi:Fe2+ or Zn2+ uptake regulation protein